MAVSGQGVYAAVVSVTARPQPPGSGPNANDGYTGTGMGLIGRNTSSLAPGINLVLVTPVAKGARVSATQTLLSGGETSIPAWGPVVRFGSLSIRLPTGRLVLDWPGTHSLQAAGDVSGAYTNVPGVTAAPYTNTFPEPLRFFRLTE